MSNPNLTNPSTPPPEMPPSSGDPSASTLPPLEPTSTFSTPDAPPLGSLPPITTTPLEPETGPSPLPKTSKEPGPMPTIPSASTTPASPPDPKTKPKFKIPKQGIILGAVSVFLVAGLAVGMFLVNRSQDIRQQAAGCSVEKGETECNDACGWRCVGPPNTCQSTCSAGGGGGSSGGSSGGDTPWCTGTSANQSESQCPTSGGWQYVFPGEGCKQSDNTYMGRCCAQGTSCPQANVSSGGSGGSSGTGSTGNNCSNVRGQVAKSNGGCEGIIQCDYDNNWNTIEFQMCTNTTTGSQATGVCQNICSGNLPGAECTPNQVQCSSNGRGKMCDETGHWGTEVNMHACGYVDNSQGTICAGKGTGEKVFVGCGNQVCGQGKTNCYQSCISVMGTMAADGNTSCVCEVGLSCSQPGAMGGDTNTSVTGGSANSGSGGCPNGGDAISCTTWNCPNGDTDGNGECTAADSGASFTITSGTSCSNPPSGCGQIDFYTAQASTSWSAKQWDDYYCGYSFLNLNCSPSTPPPTNPPVTYSCNSTCTTNTQCQTANSNYICSSGKCRHKDYTAEADCQPPVVEKTFTCSDIASNKSAPKIGDVLNFTCSAGGDGLDLVTSYQFQYSIDGAAFQTIGVSSTQKNQSLTLPVSKPGNYEIQCRACSPDKCTEWDGSPTIPAATSQTSTSSNTTSTTDTQSSGTTSTSTTGTSTGNGSTSTGTNIIDTILGLFR